MAAHTFQHQFLQTHHRHVILSRTACFVPLGSPAAEVFQRLSRLFSHIAGSCLFHGRAAVPADYLARQGVHLPLPAAPGMRVQHLLYAGKALAVNDGLMGTRHDNPLVFRHPHGLFRFVADLSVPALFQIARVGLVRQHAVDCRLSPQVFIFTARRFFVVKAMFLLVLCRGGHALLVQEPCDACRSVAC